MNGYKDIDIERFDTLLLDRDGVINVLRPADYVKKWEEFEFIPEFLEVIPFWNRHFRHIFIVTNQRGVGKGLMSEYSLECIHDKMKEEISAAGGRVDKIYCCTAVSEQDPRRKPNTGMFLEILKEHPDVVPEKCIMIGDSQSDIQFADNCGIASFRI